MSIKSFLKKTIRGITGIEHPRLFLRQLAGKINVFCRTRSKFRKPITEMTLEELKEVKRQFEALARKEDTIKQG